MVVVADFLNQAFERLRISHALTKEEVDHRATSVLRLEIVLQIK